MDKPAQSKSHPVARADNAVPTEPLVYETSSLQARQVVAGRYEIRSRLGIGGSSEVWHAFDLKLRLDVALKSFRIDRHGQEDSIEALRREVRLAREVTSPNVCRIYDLVAAGDYELISMEYVDGSTLMELLIQRGPLNLAEARDIAAQLLAGLEAVHKAGLVHHDLKPENIMITHTGRVVVMDLGIAKHAAQAEASVSGTLPYMSPEQLSGKSVDPRSDLFAVGIILAEMIHPQKILTENTREDIWNAVREDPLQLAESPWKAIITRAVALHPEDRFSSAGALSRALEEVTQQIEEKEERKPYPGLAAFTVADANYFFGREMEIEAVIKKLRQLHLMAFVGASGAGKTSFLRAGLIPSLPSEWRAVFCVPGDSPFLNLGYALVPEFCGDAEAAELANCKAPDVLLRLLHAWRKKHREVLLVVDRFEELFTLNSAEVQSGFAELIGMAAVEKDVRVLLSMRDDFLLRCHHYPRLAPIFSELTPIESLAGPALRRALVQPALTSGYRFEDESLVDEILADVEQERGALPLMAFAAAQLWEKRDRQTGELTRAAYRQIGGVAGALARHAEATMARIGTKKEPIVREMFHNLITSQNTRAGRDTEELLSVFPDKQAAEDVLRTLVDVRLLTSYEVPGMEGKKPRRRVEIIHESLLSAWPRLVRWQTQDAESAQLRDQLRQAAQLWEQRSRSQDVLWTGGAFVEFQAWRQRYSARLTTTEEAFAHAMIERANKKRHQRRLALSAMFVVLLGVLAVISVLWRQSSTARDDALLQTKRAEAGRALAAGRSVPDSDNTTKLAYAIASLELADSPQARHFALQALSGSPPAYVLEMPVTPTTTQFSPDGKWVAAGGTDGSLVLVPRSGSAPLTVSEPFQAGYFIPWEPQFSPDNEFLLWTSRQHLGTVHVWSVSQKKPNRTFQMEGLTMCQVRGENAFFLTDANGRLNTPFQWGQTAIRIWNFNSEEPRTIGTLDLGGVQWKSFDIEKSGRWIAYAKGNGVYVRSLGSSGVGSESLLGKHLGQINTIKFDPGGKGIASSDIGGEIKLWSIGSERSNPLRVIPGTGRRIDTWFGSKGTYLFATGERTLRAWDLTAPEDADPFLFPNPQDEVRSMTVDQSDSWMCIARGLNLQFYSMRQGDPYVFNGYASNVKFTADGKAFVNGLGDGSISVRNLPGERSSIPSKLGAAKNLEAESIDIDPQGKSVLATILGDGLHLISVPDGTELPLKSKLGERFYSWVAFSRDGKTVAAIGTEGIEIWELKTGHSQILEQSKGMGVYSLEYAPDGTLFSGGKGGKLLHWNLKEDSFRILGAGKSWVTGIAVSDDGRFVASATWSASNQVELHRATSELMLYDLKLQKSFPISSHGNRVYCVAFDPRSTQIITGDFDGVVRVGPITGETPHLLLGHKDPVKDVAVHPGGQFIATLDFGSVLRLWRMPEGKPLGALSSLDFLDHLRALTNSRVMPDNSAATGYRLQYEPFTGWEQLPNSRQ